MRRRNTSPIDSRSNQIDNKTYTQAIGAGAVRTTLERQAIEFLLGAQGEKGTPLHELFDFKQADAHLKPVVDRIAAMNHIHRLIQKAVVKRRDWNAERFWELLGGSLQLTLEQKTSTAKNLATLSSGGLKKLIDRLVAQDLAIEALPEEARIIFRSIQAAVRRGVMSDATDAEGAIVVEQESGHAVRWFVATLAGAFHMPAGNFERFGEMLQKWNLDPKVWPEWVGLATAAASGRAEFRAACEATTDAYDEDFWTSLSNWAFGENRLAEAEQMIFTGAHLHPHSLRLRALAAVFDTASGRLDDGAKSLEEPRVVDSMDAEATLSALICVALARNNWEEALRLFLRVVAEAPKGAGATSFHLLMALSLFALANGKVESLVAVIEEHPSMEGWRPLREALLARAAGNTDRLQRLAPEVRVSALELYKEFSEPEGKPPATPESGARPTGPRRRRGGPARA